MRTIRPGSISPNYFSRFDMNTYFVSKTCSMKFMAVPRLIDWCRLVDHKISTINRNVRYFDLISLQTIIKINLFQSLVKEWNLDDEYFTKSSRLKALTKIHYHFRNVLSSTDTIFALTFSVKCIFKKQ